MAEKKIVSVNVDLLKKNVTDKARSVLDGAKDKVQEAIEVKDNALLGTIDKGIAMLQKARKNLK